MNTACKLLRLAAFAVLFIVTGCSNAPHLNFSHSETLTHPVNLGIGNFTVVEIDPNAEQVRLDWKGYNEKEGSWLNVPFEVIEVKTGKERYLITDDNVLNNELRINGKKFKFDANSKRILIRFGEGVSIVDGCDYTVARKVYDEPHKP